MAREKKQLPPPFRCFLLAWMAAWVTAVFLPSAIIAYLGFARAAASTGTGFGQVAAGTWKVADDVGPVVKLSIGSLLLIGFLGLGRAGVRSGVIGFAASTSIGLLAMALTIALVPTTLSRGFAAALTVTRSYPSLTCIYLLGGALAGLVFIIGFLRCQSGQGK